MRRCLKLSRFFSLLFIGGLLANTSYAQKYSVTELPILPGGSYALGSGMNNTGQVVGSADDSNGVNQAILWSNGIATMPFVAPSFPGGSSGTAINKSGVIIGTFGSVDGSAIFAVGPNVGSGFESDLGPQAYTIDDFNNVFGSERGHPTIWVNGDLGFTSTGLPNSLNYSAASAMPLGVNSAGTVVGEEDHLDANFNTFPVAIRWTPAATNDPWSKWAYSTTKLLSGLSGAASTAEAVNSSGWIVGWAALKNGFTHAVLWEPASGAYDLGTLGGKNSAAHGINTWGDIAGESQNAYGAERAVLWTHKNFTIVDLNVEIGAAWAAKITLTQAVATNDRCMVLVNGLDHKSGAERSFVLALTTQSNCKSP